MEQGKKLEEIKKATATFANDLVKVAVITNANFPKASEFLVQIKQRIKRIEEIRLGYTKPLNESLKKINADFKGAMKPYEEMEQTLKRGIMSFREIEEAKRRAEEERLQKIAEEKARKEAKKKHISVASVMENMPVPVVERQSNVMQSESGALKARKVWKHEIVDEKKVPKKYWIIDETGIRFAVRNGEREIPGVRIYEEEQISVY